MKLCICGNHRERMGEHRDGCPARHRRPSRLARAWDSRPSGEDIGMGALVVSGLSVAAMLVGVAAWIVRWGFGL